MDIVPWQCTCLYAFPYSWPDFLARHKITLILCSFFWIWPYRFFFCFQILNILWKIMFFRWLKLKKLLWEWYTTTTENKFKDMFQHLKKWKQCINCGVNYFEEVKLCWIVRNAIHFFFRSRFSFWTNLVYQSEKWKNTVLQTNINTIYFTTLVIGE